MNTRAEKISILNALSKGKISLKELKEQFCTEKPNTVSNVIASLIGTPADTLLSVYNITRISIYEKIVECKNISHLQSLLSLDEKRFVAFVTTQPPCNLPRRLHGRRSCLNLEHLTDGELRVLIRYTRDECINPKTQFTDDFINI